MASEGLSESWIECSTRSRRSSYSATAPRSERTFSNSEISAPAAKASLPAPRKAMQRTSASRSNSAIAAEHEERGNRHFLQALAQVVERGPAALHAEQRIRGAERRMLGELREVFGEGALILELELHALRTDAVRGDELRHAFAPDALGVGARILLELLVMRRVRAIRAARHRDGECAIGIVHAEMQRGEGAHREADDMRPLDLQTIEHAADVVARTLLGIAVPVFRHFGGRIAPRVVPDAAIQACEVAHLRLPAAQVAAEFMHEDERGAGARLLVM